MLGLKESRLICTRSEARRKRLEYEAVPQKHRQPFHSDLARAFQQLEMGRTVISLTQAFSFLASKLDESFAVTLVRLRLARANERLILLIEDDEAADGFLRHAGDGSVDAFVGSDGVDGGGFAGERVSHCRRLAATCAVASRTTTP